MSIDRQLGKEEVMHIHNGIYSAIKKNETFGLHVTKNHWDDLYAKFPDQGSGRPQRNWSFHILLTEDFVVFKVFNILNMVSAT